MLKIMKLLFVSMQGLALVSLLTACGASELEKDKPGSPSTSNSIHLERHFQRVIRKNCPGQIISDRVETVRSPTHWVKINPTDWSNVYSSDFYNRTTQDSANYISGFNTFQIDYSDGFFNMRVSSGINVIEYRFYECLETTTNKDGHKICAHPPKLKEEGTVTLSITYSEVHRPEPEYYQEPCPTASPSPQ